MNYEVYAIAKLKDYQAKVISIQNLREEIQTLKARQTSAKTSRFDAVCATAGDSSRAQDTALNLIADIDEKLKIYHDNRREIRRIERALGILAEPERAVLDAFFLCPVSNPVAYLKEKHSYEKTWVYNTRREALRKFTRAFYGTVDA